MKFIEPSGNCFHSYAGMASLNKGIREYLYGH